MRAAHQAVAVQCVIDYVPQALSIVRLGALRQRLGDDGTIAWDELAKTAGIMWQPQEYRPRAYGSVMNEQARKCLPAASG